MTTDARTSGASGNELGNALATPRTRSKPQAPMQNANDSTHESTTHAAPPTGPKQTPQATRSLTSPPPRSPLGQPLAHIRKSRTAAKTRSTVKPPASDAHIPSKAQLHATPLAHETKSPRARYAALAPRTTATARLGMMRLPRSATLQASSAKRITRSSTVSSQLAARAPAQAPTSTPHAITTLRDQTGHPASSLLATAQPAAPTAQAPNVDATTSRKTTLRTASMTPPANAPHPGEMVYEHTYANWTQVSPCAAATPDAMGHTPNLTCANDRA